MNKQETALILRILRTVWPQTRIDEDTITAYTWAFEDQPYELVEDAVKRWIKTGKFFPKPAELLEIISVQTVAPDLVPEAAWGEVIREARRVGYNRLPVFQNGEFLEPEKPVFSSPLIAQAVEAIGWGELCTLDDEDKPTVRAQFTKVLTALMTREVKRTQLGIDRQPSLPTSTTISALTDRSAS